MIGWPSPGDRRVTLSWPAGLRPASLINPFRNCKRLVVRNRGLAQLVRPVNGLTNRQNNWGIGRSDFADRRVAGMDADRDLSIGSRGAARADC